MTGVVMLMMSLTLVVSVAVVGFFSTTANGWGNSKYADKNRVLLTSVQSLVFSTDRMTNAGRVSAIPQMKCIGGSAHCNSNKLPRVMQCQNVGTDGVDVQWKCTAELDSDVKLGRTDVICEGYEYPDDPYILRGSCGVEYELDTTGQRSSSSHHSYDHGGRNYYQNTTTYESGWSFSTLFFYAMVAFVFYAFYRSCIARQTIQAATGPATGYGAPYQGGPQYPPNCPPTYQDATYRPGFWSGLGLGGLIGNMFSRRPRYGYGGYGNAYYGRPAYQSRGWFGSTGRTYTGGSHTGGSGFRSTSGTTSHSSTGYGSTRRR
eukprot:m.36339 g.36339  ORF g.36339 m.36339 type:complete len:318 (+) comp10084_c0_seq6:75-1028(+)